MQEGGAEAAVTSSAHGGRGEGQRGAESLLKLRGMQSHQRVNSVSDSSWVVKGRAKIIKINQT